MVHSQSSAAQRRVSTLRWCRNGVRTRAQESCSGMDAVQRIGVVVAVGIRAAEALAPVSDSRPAVPAHSGARVAEILKPHTKNFASGRAFSCSCYIGGLSYAAGRGFHWCSDSSFRETRNQAWQRKT